MKSKVIHRQIAVALTTFVILTTFVFTNSNPASSATESVEKKTTTTLKSKKIPKSRRNSEPAKIWKDDPTQRIQGFPMCSAQRTGTCLEELSVNGVVLTDISAQYNTTTRVFEVPGYVSPEGKNYTNLIGVYIADIGAYFVTAIQPFTTLTGEELIRFGETIGLDPSWNISIRINFGSRELYESGVVGRLGSYSVSTNDRGDVIVQLTARPEERSVIRGFRNGPVLRDPSQLMSVDEWHRVCSAPDAKADVDLPPKLNIYTKKFYGPPGHSQASTNRLGFSTESHLLKGMVYSSNSGCGELPTPLWDERRKSLFIQPVAPHFKSDGSINTGYYSALIPFALIFEKFGVTAEEFVQQNLVLTGSYENGQQQEIPLTTRMDTNGVWVTATENFHYSAPRLLLRNTKSKRGSLPRAEVQTQIKRISRGGVLRGSATVPGVAKGHVKVFLADENGIYRHLVTTRIVRGVVKMNTKVPEDLVGNKGKLLFNYPGSSKSSRFISIKQIRIR